MNNKKSKRDIKPEAFKMSLFLQGKGGESKLGGGRLETDKIYTTTAKKGGQEKLNTTQIHSAVNWNIF